MVFPVLPADPGAPAGHSYAAALTRLDGVSRADVLDALREVRFSGWLSGAAPSSPGPSSAGSSSEDHWLAAVTRPADGTVAAGRRGVVGVGEWLHTRLAVPVLAVRVRDDRQLVLVTWADGAETARYVSDPSREPDADREVLTDPLGAEDAAEIADACGRPDAAGDLGEILAEELDPDSFIESERLARVLRLLDLPTWLVAAATLPSAVPTGPSRRDLTRLGAGVPGLLGYPAGRVVGPIRRRRPPPPVVTDAPRGRGMDPWLM